MRKSNPIVNLVEAYGLGVDKQRGRMSFAEAMDSLDALKRDSTQTQDNAYAFALALALLTWLHGSQAPDVRAELGAWMRAGIDGAKVKP